MSTGTTKQNACPVCGAPLPAWPPPGPCEACGTDLSAAGLAPSSGLASVAKSSTATGTPGKASPGSGAGPTVPPPGAGGSGGTSPKPPAGRPRRILAWSLAVLAVILGLFAIAGRERFRSRKFQPPVTAPPTVETPAAKYWVRVAVSTARIRAGPTTSAAVVTHVYQGQRLGVFGTNNGWYQVLVPSSTGAPVVGWVFGELVVSESSSVPRKPTTPPFRMPSPRTPASTLAWNENRAFLPTPTASAPRAIIPKNPDSVLSGETSSALKEKTAQPESNPPTGAVDSLHSSSAKGLPSRREPGTAAPARPEKWGIPQERKRFSEERELATPSAAAGIWEGSVRIHDQIFPAAIVLVGDSRGNLSGSLSVQRTSCRMAVKSLSSVEHSIDFYAEPLWPGVDKTCSPFRLFSFQFLSPTQVAVTFRDLDENWVWQTVLFKREDHVPETEPTATATPKAKYPSPRRW